MATLADILRQTGYTPDGTTPTDSPMTKVLAEHIKSIPQKFAQNQQAQMDLLGKAYPGNTYESMMTQGDPKALAELAMQAPFNAMVAYHGTPHNILGKFDISKVGTGEGAQAYGHGMYFAENPNVAKEYQKRLSADSALNYQARGLDSAYVSAANSFKEYGSNYDETLKGLKSAYKNATEKDLELAAKVAFQPTGNLYKVDIPDEYIPNMLDWDKPISQQPIVMKALQSEAEQRVKDRTLTNIENEIRKSLPPIEIGNDYMAMFSDANIKANQEIKNQALKKLNKMDLSSLINKELESMKPLDMNWNMTGKEYYEFLSKIQGSPAKASQLLSEKGVSGIRYLDQGSRPVAGGEIIDVFKTPEGWKSKIKVTNRNGIAFQVPSDMFTTSMPFKTEAEAKKWAEEKINSGTSNFVIFDPSEVKILEKNNKPVSRKELIEEQVNKLKD